MATKNKPVPPRGDRVQTWWGRTEWGNTFPTERTPDVKFRTVTGEAQPPPPTKAARKAALRMTPKKAAPAPVDARTAPRTGPNPSKPSRRAQRAALVARKAAYREALRDWVMGVAIDNADALRAIGLRVASERPKGLGSDVGGMDKALEAMERATGRELPATGPFISSLSSAYHGGMDVWHKRRRAREAEAKTSREGRLAERESGDARDGRMRVTIHTRAPLMRRELHLRLYDLAEHLVGCTFTTPARPARMTRSQFFRLSVAETWHEHNVPVQPKRYKPTVGVNNPRMKSAYVHLTLDANVLPLWRAGLAGHYGPRTLIIGIDRAHPAQCFVARQRGPYSFVLTRQATPHHP